MLRFFSSLISLPLSLRIPLSTLSFIPHKHMWCGALLMRTEWTDPRPQCHWGPPPQIHHRYQFSSIPFKRPQCGIPNTLLYYPIANSPKSFYYASPFFICPPWKSFKCLFLERICLENCWQSHAFSSHCIVDHITDIPLDVSPPLGVKEPSYIPQLCSLTCSWLQIFLKSLLEIMEHHESITKCGPHMQTN